jgi:hypothetical protein
MDKENPHRRSLMKTSTDLMSANINSVPQKAIIPDLPWVNPDPRQSFSAGRKCALPVTTLDFFFLLERLNRSHIRRQTVNTIVSLMTWQPPIRLFAGNLQQSEGPPGVGRWSFLRRPSQLGEWERESDAHIRLDPYLLDDWYIYRLHFTVDA